MNDAQALTILSSQCATRVRSWSRFNMLEAVEGAIGRLLHPS
jgi:hypothetical protein